MTPAVFGAFLGFLGVRRFVLYFPAPRLTAAMSVRSLVSFHWEKLTEARIREFTMSVHERSGLRPTSWALERARPAPEAAFHRVWPGDRAPQLCRPPGEGLSSQGREHERFFTNRSQTQENLQLTVQTQPPRTCIP